MARQRQTLLREHRPVGIAAIDTLRIAIAGAGRMGQAIAKLAGAAEDLVLAGVWCRSPDRDTGRFTANTKLSEDLQGLVADSDVLIDFSLPEGTMLAAKTAATAGKPLVCGVSGLDGQQVEALEAAARLVPVVYDRNMSQGIAVLTAVAEQVAAALGEDFRVCVDETHHVHKLDAPSGTALKLGEAVAAARGRDFSDVKWFEETGEPPGDAIRFEVERRGEVPGDHAVRFETAAERLILAHSVTTREVFANGALRAARWIVGRDPGLYGMRDVLGLTKRGKNSN